MNTKPEGSNVMKLMRRAACVWVVWQVAVLGAGVWGAPNDGNSGSGGAGAAIKAESGKTIQVHARQSVGVDAAWNIKRVSVTDPAIADVQLLSPQKVLVLGKAVGTTDLLLWNAKEEAVQMRIVVSVDLAYLQAELRHIFPGAALEASQSGNVLVVRGTLNRVEAVAELTRYLDGMNVKYVNMTRVGGVQQVLLRVRLAEVDRTVIRELGINMFQANDRFFGGSAIGPDKGGALNPISIGVANNTGLNAAPGTPSLPFSFTGAATVSPAMTLFGGLENADLEMFIQALTENQYLRLLAEPNLVALSGEEASFLAGGEVPIPVPQNSGGGGGTTITIQYQPYGIQLKFRPTVLGDGTIRLYVGPEVSELDYSNAVTLPGSSPIPALLTRKAESTVELKSGQTFAIAGLLNQSISSRNSMVPLLGNLPVLGPLFRSIRYQSQETELVVIATATLVEPMSLVKPPPVPGVAHAPPSDWDFYVEGRLEGKQPPKLSPTDAAYLKNLGFDLLKGPGSWETYDQGMARSEATQRPVQATPVAAPVQAKPIAVIEAAPAAPASAN